MTVHGVDISRFQSTYVPGPDDHFVIVKASEGRTVRNEFHDDQVARVLAAGKMVGHYHWLWPENTEEQLDKFGFEAKPKPGHILACDWENAPSNPALWPSVQDLEAWLRGAKRRWPQCRVIYYTYSFYPPFMLTGGDFYQADGPWIADYRANPLGDIFDLTPVIHQYSDHPIDQNRAFFDTPAQMRAWANGLIPPPPPPPEEEDDMPYTKTELKAIFKEALTEWAKTEEGKTLIAKAVLATDGIIERGEFAPASAGEHVTLETAIKSIRGAL